MNSLLSAINWRFTLILSLLVLLVLMVLNFYGLYTGRFYFLKVDNYIFPLLGILHFKYIHTMWLKIHKKGYPDAQIRNLEYGLYPVLLVYAFKASDTAYMILNASGFDDALLPQNFIPMATTILALQIILILITLLSFTHRKKKIGIYNFDKINENIDFWQ